jgi:hypothetical protein
LPNAFQNLAPIPDFISSAVPRLLHKPSGMFKYMGASSKRKPPSKRVILIGGTILTPVRPPLIHFGRRREKLHGSSRRSVRARHLIYTGREPHQEPNPPQVGINRRTLV